MFHTGNPDHYRRIPPVLAKRIKTLKGKKGLYTRELKKLIRKHLMPLPRHRWDEGHYPIDLYDARVWQAIREVTSEN